MAPRNWMFPDKDKCPLLIENFLLALLIFQEAVYHWMTEELNRSIQSYLWMPKVSPNLQPKPCSNGKKSKNCTINFLYKIGFFHFKRKHPSRLLFDNKFLENTWTISYVGLILFIF